MNLLKNIDSTLKETKITAELYGLVSVKLYAKKIRRN